MTPTHLFHLSLEEAESFIKDCVQQSLSHALKSGPELALQSPISSTEAEVISVADVCKLFKITRPTISEWMKAGKVPYKRIGRRIYFIKQEVLAALQSFNKRAR